ncbi:MULTISPECIES: homoserine O-acetyltransferase/O-succinyltransferase family protein [Pseudoalteromonas]|uniref:Homoserine trans-succinylase n=1 Tax=Pseudoalteromonas luteoviolacea (strain 2ta16) TaxID=1353533 RepID=V4I126_PSEL2|nr:MULTISPECIES: homoserine O-succinyltransferase [Pseudoalteromonas]ESP93924.1 homoserine trans-succinylase [Pseudoalteromonas luteoviolacea 2ta16]KZN31356.1 hypothetical protein N483_05910 [Pseudoalteromonas luteoviolacea NCIMB 1944]MCG7548604.1 homoserine O-succinyltransferase [Pseudoalteromonas sp. Of7M-16]
MYKNKSTVLNIGILNLMPDLDKYQSELETLFSSLGISTKLHWLKLSSKPSSASQPAALKPPYSLYSEVIETTQLDGLIVSGAPVEKLPFSEVVYWQELLALIKSAQRRSIPLLGICWGALAIAKSIGIGKKVIEEKHNGIYDMQNQSFSHSAYSCLKQSFPMPFSIYAHLNESDVHSQIVNGVVTVLAGNDCYPHALLQTTDEMNTMCLGHPEYTSNRVLNEWLRDAANNPNSVPPVNFDLNDPKHFWKSYSEQFFVTWLQQLTSIKKAAMAPLLQESTNGDVLFYE